MKIKIMAGLILAASFCSSSYAGFCDYFDYGQIYLGPTLLVQDISANRSSFRGLHPRVSLGFANWSRKYYLATEVFLTPATLTLSDVRSSNATSARISSSFGASLLPGTLIYREILGYLRLGLINSNFSSPNSSRLGAQLGLGLHSKLNTHWALRGEYIYTAYGSVSGVGTPNSNELGVGFLYYFDA